VIYEIQGYLREWTSLVAGSRSHYNRNKPKVWQTARNPLTFW